MKHPYFAIFAQLLAQCRAYKALEISTIVDVTAEVLPLRKLIKRLKFLLL